ncbi:MAG TPA: hypothetical protein VEI07_20125, partial [Planctomycetaceae bacterium]|nr:hypothetical protein [Planctomycetaceae bacterium]
MTSHSWLSAWHGVFSPDSFGWTILDLALKATALIVLAAFLALAFGRASAALRHRIWAMLFIALLLLPAAAFALPGWDWKVIPHDWQVTTPAAGEAGPTSTPASSR